MRFGQKRSSNNKGTIAKSSVIFLPDKYFLFDKVSLPAGKLLDKEILEMAQLSIEAMLPSSDYETLSGYFVDQGNVMTVFVASKERLKSEYPNMSKFAYWFPKVVLSLSSAKMNDLAADTEQPLILELNLDDILPGGDGSIDIFSKQFWNAELHSKKEKKIARHRHLITKTANHLFGPIFSTAVLAILAFTISFITISCTNWQLTATLKKSSAVTKIRKNFDLLTQLTSFSNTKMACFDYLSTINLQRPSSLFFNKFSMQAPKCIEASGGCPSMQVLNTFVANLNGEATISNAKLENVQSTSDGTSFKLKVEFI